TDRRIHYMISKGGSETLLSALVKTAQSTSPNFTLLLPTLHLLAKVGHRDLEKAYDRVPREELWYCMRKSGVAEKYVRVVQDMYERSRTVVSESREQVEENLERWRFALERRGMKVSRSKTEYMCVNEREGSGTVRLQGEEVKKVQEFKYLGSTVQSNGEFGKEVKKRVQAGWNGWRKVSGVLCDWKISARIKGKVYRTVVRAAMLYGLETVSLRKRQESELEVAELKMLRFSLGVTRLDRIRNKYIRGSAHVGRLGDKVREARLRWFGHVQRRENRMIGVKAEKADAVLLTLRLLQQNSENDRRAAACLWVIATFCSSVSTATLLGENRALDVVFKLITPPAAKHTYTVNDFNCVSEENARLAVGKGYISGLLSVYEDWHRQDTQSEHIAIRRAFLHCFHRAAKTSAGRHALLTEGGVTVLYNTTQACLVMKASESLVESAVQLMRKCLPKLPLPLSSDRSTYSFLLPEHPEEAWESDSGANDVNSEDDSDDEQENEEPEYHDYEDDLETDVNKLQARPDPDRPKEQLDQYSHFCPELHHNFQVIFTSSSSFTFIFTSTFTSSVIFTFTSTSTSTSTSISSSTFTFISTFTFNFNSTSFSTFTFPFTSTFTLSSTSTFISTSTFTFNSTSFFTFTSTFTYTSTSTITSSSSFTLISTSIFTSTIIFTFTSTSTSSSTFISTFTSISTFTATSSSTTFTSTSTFTFTSTSFSTFTSTATSTSSFTYTFTTSINFFSNLSNSSSSVGSDHTGQPSLHTCISEPWPLMTLTPGVSSVSASENRK
ncbi:hypothetical protein QTP86_031259, partial [Hemibagrus guttatus]